LQIVERMFEHKVYDFDTVVTFIYGEYRKPLKKRSEESGEGGNDEVFAHPFILCSVNQTKQPETSLAFSYTQKEFKADNDVNPITKLTNPVSGFLFHASQYNGSIDCHNL